MEGKKGKIHVVSVIFLRGNCLNTAILNGVHLRYPFPSFNIDGKTSVSPIFPHKIYVNINQLGTMELRFTRKQRKQFRKNAKVAIVTKLKSENNSCRFLARHALRSRQTEH